MAACERALVERRDADALAHLRAAEAVMPDHPLVLHERGRRALNAGNPREAEGLFLRCIERGAHHLPFWLALANARRVLADYPGELEALEHALEIDPQHPLALLQKGAVLDLMGKPRVAVHVYGNALQTINPAHRLPPAIDQLVQTARRRVAEGAAELASHLDARLAAVRETVSVNERRRFERSVDRLLGRRPVYQPNPTFMLFPYLSNQEFYPRELFPWLGDLEAATDEIRAECIGAMREDDAGMVPYIDYAEGLPLNQWSELNRSRRWSAYFLWKEGKAEVSHQTRCPRTVEALARCPQVDIVGRGPTAFFSILDAHTTIPAHTGVTNTRLTVHLPLVVPPGCEFRVGGDTRPWKTGEAWVFDDSIEHEARNTSAEPRAILIFDVWHPELTEAERELVRGSMIAVADFYEAEGMAAAMGL